MVEIIHLLDISPDALARRMAAAMRARRVAEGWTREVLASRAGVSPDLVKHFETTGRVTLDKLLRMAVALSAEAEFAALFAPRPVVTLADLEAREAQRGRVYGRRRDAGRRRTGSEDI